MARILVIEDDEAVQELIKEILVAAGHQIVLAADGRAGMACVVENSMDLIITDNIMPEQEGLETIQRLRRQGASLPILAISGGRLRGNTDFLEIAREFGATDTLTKPFRAQDLVTKVIGLLGGSANAA